MVAPPEVVLVAAEQQPKWCGIGVAFIGDVQLIELLNTFKGKTLSILLAAVFLPGLIFADTRLDCGQLLGGTSPTAELVPGLFDKLSIRHHVKLVDGVMLDFEDFNDGRSLETQVVARRGDQVLWRGHLELVVKDDEFVLDVIAIDGDEVPGFIKPEDHTFLNEKGIPLSSFILMRGMKLLGREDITKFRVEKIRHAETVVAIAEYLHAQHAETGEHLVTANEIVEVYKKHALHRLAMTSLIQSGFKVLRLELSPGENQVSVRGTTPVKTMFSPQDFVQGGVVTLTRGSEISMGQFKSPALDKKKLEKRLAVLMDQHPELKDLLVDFSMVYFLSSI